LGLLHHLEGVMSETFPQLPPKLQLVITLSDSPERPLSKSTVVMNYERSQQQPRFRLTGVRVEHSSYSYLISIWSEIQELQSNQYMAGGDAAAALGLKERLLHLYNNPDIILNNDVSIDIFEQADGHAKYLQTVKWNFQPATFVERAP
jgi:hypothetical protein